MPSKFKNGDFLYNKTTKEYCLVLYSEEIWYVLKYLNGEYKNHHLTKFAHYIEGKFNKIESNNITKTLYGV